MINEALGLIVFIGGFVFIINLVILMKLLIGDWHLPLLPTEFKKEYKFNWFGAIMLFIILLPLAVFIYLYMFICFAFTSRWPKH